MKISVGWFAMSAIVLTMVAMGVADAQNCSSSITSCGCTITSPGVYTVDADLTAGQGLTSRQGCIDVAANSVKLITNAHAITGAGTGTGIGIHLLSSAENVFVEAAGPVPAGQLFGPFTTLMGWQYGLESDASNVISDDFIYRNNTTGVLLKGARNNNINDFSANNNSAYGVWIKGGSGNQINCSGSANNKVAGVYLGCSSTGPSGQVCEEDEGTTHGNFIYDHSATVFGSGSTQNYGIAVEHGSKGNTIIETGSRGNSVYDLFDGNPNCDSNLWRVNGFTTANPTSCIH
jgi:hypothetical protein